MLETVPSAALHKHAHAGLTSEHDVPLSKQTLHTHVRAHEHAHEGGGGGGGGVLVVKKQMSKTSVASTGGERSERQRWWAEPSHASPRQLKVPPGLQGAAASPLSALLQREH